MGLAWDCSSTRDRLCVVYSIFPLSFFLFSHLPLSFSPFFLSFFLLCAGTSWLVLMLDKTNNAKAIDGLQLRGVREAGGASAPWEGSLKFGDSKIQIFVGNVVGVFCAHVCIFQGSFDHMKREGML